MEPDPKLRAGLEPSWNDLREQRLLGRIVEARRQRGARRGPRMALALAMACAAIAVVSWRVATSGWTLRAPVVAGASAAPASSDAFSSRMTLADGSEAILGPDGNVQVEEQAPTRVRLRQRAGAARYVVRPDPSREFVVLAEGVSVRVRGTIFSVAIHAEAVEVSVERGRVEVADGSRVRDLVAGEAFRIPLHPADDDAPDGSSALPPSRPPLRTAFTAPPSSAASTTSAAALLAHADDARASGNPGEAVRALETFAATYPHEARLPAALFTLGRVERTRGRPEAAAPAFERCANALPAGPLADDALAEAAQSWNAAGAVNRARADANAYLSVHPAGIHAAAMRALVAH